MKNKKMWAAAEKASLESPYPIYKIGAAAKVGRKIVSAFNQPKTHPMQAHYNEHSNFLHAEIALLAKTGPIKEIWVFRYNKAGRIAMCRPCKGCMLALMAFGVEKINYTTGEGYATETI